MLIVDLKMESKSIKSVGFSSTLMKISTLSLLLIIGFASAQYLTISSCSNYNLGSYLGNQVPGVYPVFPVFNFTIFNTTVTQSSDVALYKNLCNSNNNVFYGLNASLQTCSNYNPTGSLPNAAWKDTGFSVENISYSITILNNSNFTYIPTNATSENLSKFYPSHPNFQNSLNKTVNISESNASMNFTFYGMALNNSAQPACYFPINLNVQNFSILVNSTSTNGSLILTQTQNETFNLENSSGSWSLNTFFQPKTFVYNYTGSLPATFNIMVESLSDPAEITQLVIENASLVINFSDVKSDGLGVRYINQNGLAVSVLRTNANPFDLTFSANGLNIELKADPSFDSTFGSSYNVSIVNVSITSQVGYVHTVINYGKSLLNTLFGTNTPSGQAETNGKNQVNSMKLAQQLYENSLQNCYKDVNAYCAQTCNGNDLSNARSEYGKLQFNVKYPQYDNYQSCDAYARGVTDYAG